MNEANSPHLESHHQNDMAQQLAQCETLVKKYLSKDALERYGNLKTGHPSLSQQVVLVLAQAITSGHVSDLIDDTTFKQLLREINQKKDFTIKRK